jgi:hypothetical protein
LRLDGRDVANYPKADMAPMPRATGTTLGELVGKLAVLVVECPKCGRAGRYALRRLIEQHGRDGTIIDWLDEVTADWPAQPRREH